MARRPNVPAFGNWDKEQGYTVIFGNAPQVKRGKTTNPNDTFSNHGPSAPTRAPPPKSKPEPRRDLGDYGSHHKQKPCEISGERQMRRPRPSAGSVNSFGRTPPRPQGRNAPNGTPGRPRSNSRGQVAGNAGRGAAIPKFGEWDEKTANGFTQIFQNVGDEKNTREVRPPVMAAKPPPSTARKPNTKDKAKVLCFPCLRRLILG